MSDDPERDLHILGAAVSVSKDGGEVTLPFDATEDEIKRLMDVAAALALGHDENPAQPSEED